MPTLTQRFTALLLFVAAGVFFPAGTSAQSLSDLNEALRALQKLKEIAESRSAPPQRPPDAPAAGPRDAPSPSDPSAAQAENRQRIRLQRTQPDMRRLNFDPESPTVSVAVVRAILEHNALTARRLDYELSNATGKCRVGSAGTAMGACMIAAQEAYTRGKETQLVPQIADENAVRTVEQCADPDAPCASFNTGTTNCSSQFDRCSGGLNIVSPAGKYASRIIPLAEALKLRGEENYAWAWRFDPRSGEKSNVPARTPEPAPLGPGVADLTHGPKLDTDAAKLLASTLTRLAGTSDAVLRNFSTPPLTGPARFDFINGNLEQISNIVNSAPTEQQAQLAGNMVLQIRMQADKTGTFLLHHLINLVPVTKTSKYRIYDGRTAPSQDTNFVERVVRGTARYDKYPPNDVDLKGLLQLIVLGELSETAKQVIPVPPNEYAERLASTPQPHAEYVLGQPYSLREMKD